MPYIPQERRAAVVEGDALDAGELNYKLTMILASGDEKADQHLRVLLACRRYLGLKEDGPRYAHFNEVMGVLACAAYEHQRRHWPGADVLADIADTLYITDVAPYEDGAIERNGDVEREDG